MGRGNRGHLQFRGGEYYKRVVFGKRTVKDGECCAIWNVNGVHRAVEGPARVWVWRSTVRFVDRHIANQHQYLVVQNKDGSTQHLRGPMTFWFNPVHHESVAVRDAIDVDSLQAIVVYTENEVGKQRTDPHRQENPHNSKGKGVGTATYSENVPVVQQGGSSGTSVARRVVTGPATFFPAANERVLEFSWHGESNCEHPSQARVLPGHNKFTKLSLLQQQLYYNVRDVLTSDDVGITVKLMLSFQCEHVDCMLDSTHDPVGDFVNAVCADVITFAAKSTYEQFLQQTSSLSCLNTYPTLNARAAAIGFKVHKVMYRGYKAGDQVQAMHDRAVKSRSELRLKQEMADQQEALADQELSRSLERAAKEREKEAAALRHKMEMLSLKQAEDLKRTQAEHVQQIQQQQERNEAQVQFLGKLSTAGVDLTKYLVSKEQKVESVIRIEGDSDATTGGPAVHLHRQQGR